MLGVLCKTKPKPEVPAVSIEPLPAGRERLKHFDAELAKANVAAADIEDRITRLQAIIIEADQHHERLQIAILVDGGRALAEYSAGRLSDDSEIGKLAVLADSSSRAATAAKAALPKAQADLENVQSQLITLTEQRAAEVNCVLANLADVDARAYRDAFHQLCRLHDNLVGYAAVGQSNHGDIRLVIDTVKVPRFATPSLGNADADPYLRHNAPSELTVDQSARRWQAIKDRLGLDADADLTDLIH
jgi:hypothetical protein